ncbi:MAG: DNA polymerase IV [Gammaproteobacteria bacterium]|nr:DNA polymerase IV [Gammaproteobacteria bacterium]
MMHADMDAFYAAVEQHDDPSLRGKPLLIGGRSGRGVVLTASYEARPFGVHSAMPMALARRKCPDALIVPPRFERYQQVSRQVMEVFNDFSPSVEALSLDEAFLEMTGAEHIFGEPEEMGRRVRNAVREATGLAVSVGVSGTKYVAKVASDVGKPDGLVVVPQSQARAWLAPLPVKRLWGAGPKTQRRLHELGYETIGEIAETDPDVLVHQLGEIGRRFHELARAEDIRLVSGDRSSQSISADTTLEHDVHLRADIVRHLRRSADTLGRRLRSKGFLAGGVRVKLKSSGFVLTTRQAKLADPTDIADTLHRAAVQLLDGFDDAGPYRLVGLAVFNLVREANQFDLFNDGAKQRRLEAAIDQAAARFGADALLRATRLTDGLTRIAPTLDFLDEPDFE